MKKKNKILSSALELFATHGYHAVSTSSIANAAGVSEGLIFRHYTNKQGLLDVILQEASERAVELYTPIIKEENPKRVLQMAINLPFEGSEEGYHYWKLQFKLKWELEQSGREKTQPIIDKFAWAFNTLGYENPNHEAEILQHILESITGTILRGEVQSQLVLKDFLLEKYSL